MVIAPLDRKLLRDLTTLRGQIVTIALVIACGIASYVAMRTAYDSLVFSRDAYYREHRFADVFAHLERAPSSLADRLERIPGVLTVDTRIVESITLPLATMVEPARGTIVSIPADGASKLNSVHLREGRFPDPNRADEVLLLESFAEAHGLSPGDRVPAVVNGTFRELAIVGTAMSPEFVMMIAPGEMTYDPKRAAVVWMTRGAAEAIFRMEGAFDDAVLALQPGASEEAVMDAVDRLLAPYGGLGAVAREKQTSHYVLSGEMQQLEQFAIWIPLIFLLVAAFLVNVVLSRLVTLQRPEIATLKAVGYRDADVGWHYLKMVAVIAILGAAVGVSVGGWLGSELTELYTGRFFRFPSPAYRLEARTALTAGGVSIGAAVLGALLAVRSVTRLPPAEAMRAPAPASYQRTLLKAKWIPGWLGTSSRIALRELERRPLRTIVSSAGIAMAVGIMVMGRFMHDAVDELLYVQFERAMREDVTVTFHEPLAERAVRELAHLPGVRHAEGLRTAAVRLRAGHRERDATLFGYPEDGILRRLVDRQGTLIRLPEGGALVTRTLADILHVSAGDMLRLELREGDRRHTEVAIAGTVEESFGLQLHLSREAAYRLLEEEPVVNMALLSVDSDLRDDVMRRLKEMPWVLAVGSPDHFEEQFEEQSGDTMRVFTFVLTLFASIIAIGIVYNNARVALSARARDLSSLRVLGFTRREIAAILFSELAVQVILAIPIGLVVGRWMSFAMLSTVDPEAYRFPIVVSARTYAFAAAIALGAAVLSALLVRRKLDRLDLVAVLKTRE